MKQVWKKVIAVVCMAALIVTGIGVIPELQAKAEDAPAGLTSVKWSDFGFVEDFILTESNNWGVRDQALSGKNTVNSSFRGKVEFQRTNSGNMWIQYGSNIDDASSKGVRVTLANNGQLVIYDMVNGGIPFDTIEPSKTNLGEGKTFSNTEFELGIDLWTSGNDVKIIIYINGIQYNNTAYTITGGASSMLNYVDIVGQGTGNSVTIRPDMQSAPEGLTKIGWNDLGITDDKTYTTNGALSTISSTVGLTDISFRGKVQFNGTDQPTVIFGANTDTWGGLWIKTNGDNLQIIVVDGSWKVNKTITAAQVKNTEMESFANKEFELGLDIWAEENDIKVLVFVNGEQMNAAPYVWESGVRAFTDKVVAYTPSSSSVSIITEVEFSPEGLTKIGWKDFGITETKTISASSNPVKINTTSVEQIGTSFRGLVKANDVTDSAPADILFRISEWNGLWVYLYANKIVLVENCGTNGSITLGTITDTAGLSSFTNQEFELGLDMWQVSGSNNVKINVFINGQQVNKTAFVWTDGKTETSSQNVGVYTPNGTSITIIPETEASPEGLTKIGWKDVGLSEKAYAYTNGGFSVLGHCNTITLKNASFRGVVQFNGTGTKLTYGDNWDGWEHGLNLAPTAEGALTVYNALDTTNLNITLNPSEVGITSFLNQEFELGIDSWADGNDIKFNIFVNGQQYNHSAYIWKNGVGNQWLYPHITVGLKVTGKSDSITVEHPAESAVNLDDKPTGYLLNGTTIRVNDKKAANGDTLTAVGDYHVVVSGDNNVTATDVGCYTPGDSHVDGIIDIRDVVATKKEIIKATEGATYSSVSRHYAADVNNDTAYDSTDMEWIRNNIVGVTNVTPNLVAAYSLTSDPLEMPIGGFNGPYCVSDRDLITDEIYKKIADCGINFISSPVHEYPTDGNATTAIERVLTQLQLAEKYNLGCFVLDHHAQYFSETWTKESLANRMQLFSNYKSFLGLFMGDEPTVSGVYGFSTKADGETYAGEYFDRRKGVSALINSFANVTAYMNLLPYRETNEPDLKLDENLSYADAYRKYLQSYCDEYQPKFLSYDNYPFEWKMDAIKGTSTKNDYGYFKNLAIMREVAEAYQIPFWTHVQAGDQFDNESGGANNHNPSPGKFKWQINVELAFGAKGIQYFPLVQPDGYEITGTGTGATDYTRNGLIGKNGVETEWYAYAKAMNQQIKSMDHVLMNSVNKGIMAYGTDATTNINAANTCSNVKLDSFALGGDNPTITGLSSTNSEYGAIAGCFDYLGKTAVYVVNYDVTSQQDITLYFNNARVYYRVGSTAFKTAKDTYCTVSLGAGEAALIVFDYAPN